MNRLDEDLDDSALFCKSLIQKRKAVENDNPKNSKQLKLQFSQSSTKMDWPVEEKQINNANTCGGKTRLASSQNSNSKLDESRSSYFSVKKTVNTCPLCLKSFKTDSAYSGHMKQCAKTHKMTTQQLLGALELQKKQMQERRNMGLCSQKVSSPPKTISKKKKEKEAEEYDLALGLALSRSLSSTSKPTLEEFGFTSKNAAVGPSRRKNDAARKIILRERTVEERQRIIIEKVAVVLLDEKQENKFINEKRSQSLNNQVPQLWNMGENNEKRGWYVEGIKTLVLMEEQNAGKKEENTESKCTSNNIEAEISKLNLPRKDIHKDWFKMINKSKFSDFTGKTKDGQDVYLHSLVLFARCPDLLEKDCQTVFGKFNLSTVTVFLEFVYCGTLNGLSRMGINELLDLAVEFKYDELIMVLNCLKDDLLAGDGSDQIANTPLKVEMIENEHQNDKQAEQMNEKESKKAVVLEDRDLFTEDDVVDLTQNESDDEENESNAEKSYWSFMQNRKKKSEEMKVSNESEKIPNGFGEKTTNSENEPKSSDKQLHRILSDDSTTRDLDDEFRRTDNKTNSDCIILSSGSDSKTQENLAKTPTTKTPSPVHVDYEVPEFDPYDNFNFFSEEQISPVGLHSQSLIKGDISMESFKSTDVGQETAGRMDNFETAKTVGYCSTPVTVHQSGMVKSRERSRKGKIRDLSASRIIRKSLGLQQKRRISNSAKKTNFKKKNNRQERDLAEALTNTILHELSRSSVFESSPVPSSRRNMFVEMTPISGRDEFMDNVTPSPNYSNMGESLIKEQLTKYGLKKNLTKSKAKKILRYIYEELHPLYNTETGKIVKKITNTPKVGKKTKSKLKPGKNKKEVTGKKKRQTAQSNSHISSKESEEMSGESIAGSTDYDSDESEFENLSETLTQSTPCNSVDLASAFFDFLQLNPNYHQKILLYEPVWLEELQRKLKETFKKHFKIADLMDFLDQKCITFRSEAQARNIQRRNEKKKEKMKKRKNSS